jgi:DNA repair exonuclease SbcCD ATPase subunit
MMVAPTPQIEPLTAGELTAIAREIAVEANKARTRAHFATRLGEMADLLQDEEGLRARVASLKAEADRIATLTAAGDEVRRRLDNLETEFAEKEAALLKRANVSAEDVVRKAWAEAETIGLEAKRKADEAARRADEETRKRRADIAALDQALGEREKRLASINAQIERLRAKIADD